MTDFSLDNEMDIIVQARIIGKGFDSALGGGEYSVKLFDKDLFDDDFLGESTPDEEGIVKFTIDSTQFGDLAKMETRPDFYFVVYHHKKEIFRSKVMEEVDLDSTHSLFKMGEGEVVDLGSFLIDL